MSRWTLAGHGWSTGPCIRLISWVWLWTMLPRRGEHPAPVQRAKPRQRLTNPLYHFFQSGVNNPLLPTSDRWFRRWTRPTPTSPTDLRVHNVTRHSRQCLDHSTDFDQCRFRSRYEHHVRTRRRTTVQSPSLVAYRSKSSVCLLYAMQARRWGFRRLSRWRGGCSVSGFSSFADFDTGAHEKMV
jgi:hypothetical protein